MWVAPAHWGDSDSDAKPPYRVVWVTRRDRQAPKLSKTKPSSVVAEAPFGLEKDVQQSVDLEPEVLVCSRRAVAATVSSDTVLTD